MTAQVPVVGEVLPSYAHPGDAGADLTAAEAVTLKAGSGRARIHTGMRIAIPDGYAGFVLPRSGLAANHGITCLNTPGLVDSGYRGELMVVLINTDPSTDYDVHVGDRIAQLVIQRVEQAEFVAVDELDDHAAAKAASGPPVPELPEVEALARFLDERIAGHAIAKARVAHIAALKTFDPPIDALEGRTVERVTRRGKYVQVDTGGIWLVTHLARGGWIKWHDAAPTTPIKPTKSPLAFRVVLDNKSGFDMTEMGTEKRLSVWVVRDPNDIAFVASLGPEALDPAFTRAVLARLLQQAGAVQLKGALVDQRLIAGIGNAYSDDILHAARLSPFKRANKLTDDELTRLHTAMHDVLADAVDRSKGLPAAGLKQEKRSGMRVHARTGEPCPVCGDVVREVSFATKSLQYCATCQTDGKPLADRRMSRLLK